MEYYTNHNKKLLCLFLYVLLSLDQLFLTDSILIKLKNYKTEFVNKNYLSKSLNKIEKSNNILSDKSAKSTSGLEVNSSKANEKHNFKFINSEISTNKNELSPTFRPVGPNIDSTRDTSGLKYHDFYSPIINLQTKLDTIGDITQYKKEFLNKKSYAAGNYGKSRVTR